MSLEHQRLAKIEQRQEALIATVSTLSDIMIQTRTMLGELAAWLQEPPSQDLKEFLTRISLAVEQNTVATQANVAAIHALEKAIRK